MSRFKIQKFDLNEERQLPTNPGQGKSFLELLLQDSAEAEGIELPSDLFEEPIGEIALPKRQQHKKRLKFLRFPKLKEMLDMLAHTEPEKPDGYVIMNDEPKASELEKFEEEATKRDDTEEFLNNISEKLQHFGKIGRMYKQGNEAKTNTPSFAETEAEFEAGIVRSITEDENITSETLAEILVAQGQINKAVKMYEALCLKFPEKNRYFASKIKSLTKRI